MNEDNGQGMDWLASALTDDNGKTAREDADGGMFVASVGCGGALLLVFIVALLLMVR